MEYLVHTIRPPSLLIPSPMPLLMRGLPESYFEYFPVHELCLQQQTPKKNLEITAGVEEKSNSKRTTIQLANWEIERVLEKHLLSPLELWNGGFPVQCGNSAVIYEADCRGAVTTKQELLSFQRNNSSQEDIQQQIISTHLASARHSLCHQEEGRTVSLRMCRRCRNSFPVDKVTKKYMQRDECRHHPKKYTKNSMGQFSWDCCNSFLRNTEGCTSAPWHIWSGRNPGCNEKLQGFVQTRSAGSSSGMLHGVYSIDCEMAYVMTGMQLIKISVVDLDGSVVYNQFVKPSEPVIDLCTHIHGITEKDMSRSTKTLEDVQNDLLQFIHAESILVGHGLENDLRVLRLIHKRIVDTSFLFPHPRGFPFKYKLKALAEKHLRKVIQTVTHDSAEDAKITMEVMLSKIQREDSRPRLI